jgi:hypothetical protein
VAQCLGRPVAKADDIRALFHGASAQAPRLTTPRRLPCTSAIF